jgi:nitrogen fixation NifU-like protein
MQDSIYREIILEHYKDPQNYGVLENADIDVTEVNPLCGDEIRLMMQLKNNQIKMIAFESLGCAISKASASLFTESIKGKKLEELKKITSQEVLELLEVELTPARTKCSLLVYKTLLKGLANRGS